MIPNHKDNKYNRTISILNKIMSNDEYTTYFKSRCAYVPLIVVRTQEPKKDPFVDRPNLIVKKNLTYMVEFKNLPLLELKHKTIKIDSKYSFNVNLLGDTQFINHLKQHKVYVKTMFSYLNGYYEEYMMIYISKYYDNFFFEEPFNFLILANPKPQDAKKCVIS